MKLKIVFATLFFAIACVVNAGSVQAMVMPSVISNMSVTLPGDAVEIGDSGSMNLGSLQYFGSGEVWFDVYATLPAKSMISFSYSTSGFVAGNGQVSAEAPFPTVVSSIYASADPGGEGSFEDASSALAYVSAQFVGGDSSSANIVIKNLSDSAMSVMSSLGQLYAQGSIASLSVSYDVSAVPLPAALPMFGFGLLAMAGFRRKKKAELAAA